MCKSIECYLLKSNLNTSKFKITPDTTTYAWKDKKHYSQENANKNVCIFQGENGTSEWLCSNDLTSDGELVFTIKAIKVSKYQQDGSSLISIGIMDSKRKGEKLKDTLKHCVFLCLPDQTIVRGNEEGTGFKEISCKCQQLLK